MQQDRQTMPVAAAAAPEVAEEVVGEIVTPGVVAEYLEAPRPSEAAPAVAEALRVAAWRYRYDKDLQDQHQADLKRKVVTVYLEELKVLEDQYAEDEMKAEWAQVKLQQEEYEEYMAQQRAREARRQHLVMELEQEQLILRRRQLAHELEQRQLDVDMILQAAREYGQAEERARRLYHQANGAVMCTWSDSELHQDAKRHANRECDLYNEYRRHFHEAHEKAETARGRRDEAAQHLAACPKTAPPVPQHMAS